MGELLGRSAELAAFAELLGGPERALVVHGEAGVGKSALVSRALADVAHRVGGALGTLGWLAFLPLRRAFPELPADTWAGDPDFVAGAVEDALVEDALGVAVLLVEDVHWADSGSLVVLEQLIGRIPLVATVRRGDPAAVDVLARLEKAGAARLDVEPLGDPDARALVKRVHSGLSEPEIDRLVDRSGGNPLLIEELSASGDGARLELALLARCRQLPEPQLEGLGLLALAGRALPAEVLPDPVGLAESGLVLVGEDELAGIRHALLGEVIGDLLSEDRRLRCHRALARILEHPGDVARHLLAAGDREAAHEAAMRAVAESATPGERWRHLATAAESAQDDRAVELRIEASEAACTAAEPERAGELLEGLDVAGPRGPAIALARATQAFQIGDWDRYPQELAAGKAIVAQGSPEEAFLRSREAACALIVDNDPRTALTLAREAITLAERAGVSTAGAKGMAASALSDLEEPGWRKLFAEAIAEAEAEGDAYREMNGRLNLVISLTAAGDLRAASAEAGHGIERARRLRLHKKAQAFEIALLVVAGYRGDLAHVAREGAALLARSLSPGDRNDVLSAVAFGLADQGLVQQALALAAPLPQHSSHLANYHGVRVRAFAFGGQPKRALEEWEAFCAAIGNDGYAISEGAPVAAWAAWDLGLPPPAFPDLLVGRLFAGAAPELAGIEALTRERYDDARGHFLRAVDLHGERRASALMCRWAAAEAGRLGGDPGAEAELREVCAEATARGFAVVVTRCEKSLRAMGVRTTASRARGEEQLSLREQEVAELVVEGLTDREIATRLGVAHRTVQTHVASARRKLGADNRAHLAALVGER